MRRLWITRRKASAAGLMKMKVYIEDPENGDILIQDTRCRTLGELKNGQQKHFSIDSTSAKVFVAAEQNSRSTACAFVQLPPGRDDIFLSGANRRDPAAGNPFCFDGADPAEPSQSQKPERKTGKLLVAAAILLGILAGCGIGIGVAFSLANAQNGPAVPQTFQCQNLQITLTEAFSPITQPGTTACYTDGEASIMLLREDFAQKEGFETLPLDAYGAMILANNGISSDTPLEQDGSHLIFLHTWQNPQTAERFRYYTVLLKGPDAFWLVQFTAPEDTIDTWLPAFRQWADGISFVP